MQPFLTFSQRTHLVLRRQQELPHGGEAGDRRQLLRGRVQLHQADCQGGSEGACHLGQGSYVNALTYLERVTHNHNTF